MLGFTQPPVLPMDQLDLLGVEIEQEHIKEEQPKATEKIQTRRRREHDGFDFAGYTNKKTKDTKFVMKFDKGSEGVKINEKDKARRRKRKNNEESEESVAHEEEGDEDDEEDKKPAGFVDEKQRMRTKINKVISYWDRRAIQIPNVFRLARLIDDDAKNLLEFQDYSKKPVLVSGGSEKNKSSEAQSTNSIDNELANDATSHVNRRSVNLVLGLPDDILDFLR